MVDGYKLCPANSIFPQLYGFSGVADSFSPIKTDGKLNGIGMTFDGKYVVSVGNMGWNNKNFLPVSDFEYAACEGLNACSEKPDNCTGDPSVVWNRGMFQLYQIDQYEMRKYYLFAAADQHISIYDVHVLEVDQNDSAV